LLADTNVRQIIDLRKARISKGARSNGDPFFIIAYENLAVSLRPGTIEEYKKWAAVLAESVKSDEKYAQDKMAPLQLQKEEERKRDMEVEDEARKAALLS
jgi:hypothetical protein